MLTIQQKLKFCGYAVGNLVCLTIFNLLQEKIFRGRYGATDDGIVGERFTMSITFSAIQCLTFVFFSKALTLTLNHPKNETSQKYYALIGLLKITGTVASTMSLQWVSFLTQIIGKSCKPISVMMFGVLLVGKRYTYRKMIFVLTIVTGVILFVVLKDDAAETDNENLLLGIILIAISLLVEGLCGAVQDRMRSVEKPSPLNLMLHVNCWSLMYLLPGVVFDDGLKFIEFVTKHPDILQYILLAVAVASLGQIFSSAIVVGYGSLVSSLTSTTRKMFSVLLSIIIFNNHLSHWQWGAACLIFGALFADVFLSKTQQSDAPEKEGSSGVTNIPDVLKTVSEVKRIDERPEILSHISRKTEVWVIDTRL